MNAVVFIAHNRLARRHDLAGHAETHARAEAILAAFARDPDVARLPRLEPDRRLTREEALAVHTPRLVLNLESIDRTGPANLDPDTYMVPGSFEAALTTARLSVQAAERALRQAEAGFVVARPPGHHATKDRSMGFCLLNNVGLAAHFALKAGAKRILVFDHDVHHGNGTQDLFYDRSDVLYQSFHLAPHYPGTGSTEEIGTGAGNGFTMNAPLQRGDGDATVRSLLLNVFLPVARTYKPDLILVSAGFDSLDGDPLGGLRLTPGFFGEILRRLAEVQPRIVCYLEGGYQLDRIPEAALAEVQALLGRRAELPAETEAGGAERRLRQLLAGHWPSLR